jgi:glycerophosphoryl diester phosphodiesterase
MRCPELCAHRGFAAEYPENTIAALEAAIVAGARFVEIDVQLSRDGVPVLFHDRTLERMCGVRGAIHERAFAELSTLSAAESGRFGDKFRTVRIASLADFVELLRRYPRVSAFVEIKRASIEVFGADTVLERIHAAIEPVRAQCTLISFSLPALALARRKLSLPLGVVFDRWDERETAAMAEIRPEFLFCDLDGLPRSGTLRDDAWRTVIYEVADPKIALALAARGVHMVETFAIGPMLAAFRELEKKPA